MVEVPCADHFTKLVKAVERTGVCGLPAGISQSLAELDVRRGSVERRRAGCLVRCQRRWPP